MTVGERIQMHRKQLGISQEELGQKLLVSRQTISLWEKDQTVPTIDNLIRLKEIFNVSVAFKEYELNYATLIFCYKFMNLQIITSCNAFAVCVITKRIFPALEFCFKKVRRFKACVEFINLQ